MTQIKDCIHYFVQKNEHWKKCSHCGMEAPLDYKDTYGIHYNTPVENKEVLVEGKGQYRALEDTGKWVDNSNTVQVEGKEVTLTCMVCGEWFKGEEPKMCCSGRDCGCMGMPIDPIICSKECYDNLPFNKSKRDGKEVKEEDLIPFVMYLTGYKEDQAVRVYENWKRNVKNQ